MMYSNKLVVAIKANGQILREFGDIVKLPFGSEYSILIKNLNKTAAVVKLSIDGENVSGGGFYVKPNQSVEIERSIANGNLTAGNKFKFIAMNDQIASVRGTRIDDGIVRAEFQFEREEPKPTFLTTSDQFTPQWSDFQHDGWGTKKSPDIVPFGYYTGPIRSMSCNVSLMNATAQHAASCTAGVTVAGSKSDQSFSYVSARSLESEVGVIVLKLEGETETGLVHQAVDVKAKPKCVTCGRVNKGSAKFCTNCGTSLQIF